VSTATQRFQDLDRRTRAIQRVKVNAGGATGEQLAALPNGMLDADAAHRVSIAAGGFRRSIAFRNRAPHIG
jgi:hypothetical protein